MAPGVTVRPLLQLISLRSCLSVCTAALGARGFAFVGTTGLVASSSSGRGQDDGGEAPEVDTKYRSPTEALWPAGKHQERFASRLQNALSTALLNNSALRDSLVQRLGFAVKDVRMSPDNLKAFIQWDSFNGQADALNHELRRQSPRLRAEVARVLRARNVPQLVFRHDGLTARQQEIEDVFRQLDEEEQAEQRAFAAGDDEGWLEAEADAAEAAGVGQPPAGNDTRL